MACQARDGVVLILHPEGQTDDLNTGCLGGPVMAVSHTKATNLSHVMCYSLASLTARNLQGTLGQDRHIRQKSS